MSETTILEGWTTLVGLRFLVVEVSRSNSNTPHPVQLLQTSDQLVAETSTWPTHKTHNRQDIHALGEIRTHNPRKRAAANARFRLRGHWDRSHI